MGVFVALELDKIFDELFPICRSITGDGLRQSLAICGQYIPLTIESTPSGEEVFDWVVPPEWNITSARLTGPDGEVVADFSEHNLRVVNYSAPVTAELPLEELKKHLHSLPHLPDLIPYVTSYYRENWGFCLTHHELTALKPGMYRAQIESEFRQGEVNYGTAYLAGESGAEFLISSYLCHPSMANNELSGPLVLMALYHRIAQWPKRRFSYRFVLAPETIGSLCYLHRYGEQLKACCIGGLVLTCLGGPKESLSIKKARPPQALINRVLACLERENPHAWGSREFSPCNGSDERQYGSPGFNLPVAQAARTVYGHFPEYHTSGDTKEFMRIEQLNRAVDQLESLLKIHENSGYFVRTNPYGEPQLGRRDLYPNMNTPRASGQSSDSLIDGRTQLNAMLWVLNLADGQHSIPDISERSGLPISTLISVIPRLEESNLLRFVATEV